MNVFDVPKGEDDIRLVYDGTKSKLNDHLWAPWFPLPTVESLLRSVGPTTWLGDNDIAEQFHNFSLHPGLQPYCGLDLTGLFPERRTDRSGSKDELGKVDALSDGDKNLTASGRTGDDVV
jgi:hypothetical protein